MPYPSCSFSSWEKGGMRVLYSAYRPRPSQKPSPPFGRATPLLQNATLLLHNATVLLQNATLCYTPATPNSHPISAITTAAASTSDFPPYLTMLHMDCSPLPLGEDQGEGAVLGIPPSTFTRDCPCAPPLFDVLRTTFRGMLHNATQCNIDATKCNTLQHRCNILTAPKIRCKSIIQRNLRFYSIP